MPSGTLRPRSIGRLLLLGLCLRWVGRWQVPTWSSQAFLKSPPASSGSQHRRSLRGDVPHADVAGIDVEAERHAEGSSSSSGNSLRRWVLWATASSLLCSIGAASTAGLVAFGLPVAARADEAVVGGFRAKLAKKRYAELTSPIFNIPPRQQVYPAWLEGTWSAEQVFSGAAFPTLPKAQVLQEVDVPGFKTCSIIDFADVGKSPVGYQMRWKREGDSVFEDSAFNFKAMVGAHLSGRGEVTEVSYMPKQDPNRLTLRIRGSKNAERVELFVNARDAESPQSEPDLFFASEYRRQVTFSSRVLQGYNCNYQHFKSFQRLDPDSAKLNILTAAYIDPLNPLYMQTFDKPVVVFSHNVKLSRSSA